MSDSVSIGGGVYLTHTHRKYAYGNLSTSLNISTHCFNPHRLYNPNKFYDNHFLSLYDVPLMRIVLLSEKSNPDKRTWHFTLHNGETKTCISKIITAAETYYQSFFQFSPKIKDFSYSNTRVTSCLTREGMQAIVDSYSNREDFPCSRCHMDRPIPTFCHFRPQDGATPKETINKLYAFMHSINDELKQRKMVIDEKYLRLIAPAETYNFFGGETCPRSRLQQANEEHQEENTSMDKSQNSNSSGFRKVKNTFKNRSASGFLDIARNMPSTSGIKRAKKQGFVKRVKQALNTVKATVKGRKPMSDNMPLNLATNESENEEASIDDHTKYKASTPPAYNHSNSSKPRGAFHFYTASEDSNDYFEGINSSDLPYSSTSPSHENAEDSDFEDLVADLEYDNPADQANSDEDVAGTADSNLPETPGKKNPRKRAREEKENIESNVQDTPKSGNSSNPQTRRKLEF